MDKNFNTDIKSQEVTQQELDLINRFTRKELKADDVFVFSVILCDNEIDRDGERFDDLALEKLKELFIGVTGIFDHSHSGKNQTSRIFDTSIIEYSDRKTSYGKQYKCLKARAYMPRTESNKNLITEIDAGIKKEVSVCCSVKGYVCSVCGNDMRSERCSHIKGAEYSGNICHCILKDPCDAYEWSFVAVPAQAGAGVVKSYPEYKVAKTFSECEKDLHNGNEIVISRSLSKELGEKFSRLEKAAEEGKAYRNDLTQQAVKYASLVLDTANVETIKEVCDKLDIEKLKDLRDSFFDKANQVIPLVSQLKPSKKCESNNNQFIF